MKKSLVLSLLLPCAVFFVSCGDNTAKEDGKACDSATFVSECDGDTRRH